MKPEDDVYLYGRYCDFYHTSKKLTHIQKQNDAVNKTAKHYRQTKNKKAIRRMTEYRRIAVGGNSVEVC